MPILKILNIGFDILIVLLLALAIKDFFHPKPKTKHEKEIDKHNKELYPDFKDTLPFSFQKDDEE